MRPRDPNLQDYRLEAAPEDAEGETETTAYTISSCPAPFLTYDDIMARVEKDPLLGAIVKDREHYLSLIARDSARDVAIEGAIRKGFLIEPKFAPVAVEYDVPKTVEVTCKGTWSVEDRAKFFSELEQLSRLCDVGIVPRSVVIDSISAEVPLLDPKTESEEIIHSFYEGALDAARYSGVVVMKNPCAEVLLSDYQRDPFWDQWQGLKAQLDATTEWKKPIFFDEVAGDDHDKKMTSEEIYLSYKHWLNSPSAEVDGMAMSASEMDWDDEEEDTQPGIGTGNLDVVAAPTATEFGYPKITTDGVGLTDRCYFCATKKNITRFMRSNLDYITTCVFCLYDHLGWELTSDGQLRKVLADI